MRKPSHRAPPAHKPAVGLRPAQVDICWTSPTPKDGACVTEYRVAMRTVDAGVASNWQLQSFSNGTSCTVVERLQNSRGYQFAVQAYSAPLQVSEHHL
jgi:hypothetical protein